MMFYSGLYERIEWLNGVSCSCSENGFAEEYGYLVSPCCVIFYTMMMFHGVVIPPSNTRAHSFFVMLNLYILEQNQSVVILHYFPQYLLVLAFVLTDVISFIIQVSKERLLLSSPVWVGMPLFPAGMWFIQTALLLHGLVATLDLL